jgi:hypothetical protein
MADQALGDKIACKSSLCAVLIDYYNGKLANYVLRDGIVCKLYLYDALINRYNGS